eukprot:jgi/Phyca11/21190/fgenesh1_pg.PHYCAscaffold_85_\
MKEQVRKMLIKKVDLVHVFRLELELGNSAAVYDERKRQDKVNRFIQDAEVVKEHLGQWCLWKFVELELQANLQAVIVDDPENVNNRRKRKEQGDVQDVDDLMTGEIESDSVNEPEDGEMEEKEDDDEVMDVATVEMNDDNEEKSEQKMRTERLMAKFIGADVEIDESTKLKFDRF